MGGGTTVMRLVDVATGTTRTLDLDGHFAIAPSWSPDGTRIAFVAVAPGGHVQRLEVVDVVGGGLRTLDTSPKRAFIFSPTWSPDGSSVAYVRTTPYSNDSEMRLTVAVVPSAGGLPKNIAPAGHCFCLGLTPGLSWSPDGTQFAIVRSAPAQQTSLWVMNADGSNPRLVLRGANGRPAWRPVP